MSALNFSFQGLAHFLQSTPWVWNVQYIQHNWKSWMCCFIFRVFPQPIRLAPRPSICPYQGQCIAPKGKRGLIEILLSSFQTYWVARKFLCNNKHWFILKCLEIFSNVAMIVYSALFLFFFFANPPTYLPLINHRLAHLLFEDMPKRKLRKIWFTGKQQGLEFSTWQDLNFAWFWYKEFFKTVCFVTIPILFYSNTFFMLT